MDRDPRGQKKSLLKCMYFVGKASAMCKEETPFYKYNTECKRHRVEKTSILNDNVQDETKKAMDKLLEHFALGYFTSEDNNVIGNFQRGPGCLFKKFACSQRNFLK